MFIPLPVSFAFVIFSSFNSSFPSLPLQEIGKWTVSVYCSFSFSDTPFVSLFCFLSTFVGLLKLRWNLSVCSPIRAFHGPYCYDASTHLSLFSSILPFIKRWGWLFFFLAVLFSQIVFSCHLCSLSLRSLLCSFGFLCQDEKITRLLFVVFALRVFPLVLCHMLLVWQLGSNELTHHALLMCSGGIR